MAARTLVLFLWCSLQVVLGFVGPRNTQWPSYEFGENTEPGSLLLTMLIKNEAANLERSLPLWAQVP